MIEIKTLEVENILEKSTIDLYLNFGWSLKSSQRIYNQDSHLEQRNGDVYSVTNTVNYTKLVFERDTNMANYDELNRLEERYHFIRNLPPQKKPEEFPDVANAEEWAKKTNVSWLSKSEVNFLIVGSLILGFLIGVIAYFVIQLKVFQADINFGDILGSIIIGVISAFICCFVGGFITDTAISNSRLKKALKNSNSKQYKKLIKMYEDACKDYELKKKLYDSYQNAMEELQGILPRAKSLLR